MAVLAETLTTIDPKEHASMAGFERLCKALVDPRRTLQLQPALLLLSRLWSLPEVSDKQKASFSGALKTRLFNEVQNGGMDSQLGVLYDQHASWLATGFALTASDAAILLGEALSHLPKGSWLDWTEQEENVLALISCLLTKQMSSHDVSTTQLGNLHSLAMRELHSIQIAILRSLKSQHNRPSRVSAEEILDLPSLTTIHVLLHIASRCATIPHQCSQRSTPAHTAQLSDSLTRQSPMKRESSLTAPTRQDSNLQARARSRDLSRQTAEQSSRRLDEKRGPGGGGFLAQTVDVFLTLLEACAALLWEATPDGEEGHFTINIANLALKELSSILSQHFSQPALSGDEINRLQALLLSLYLLCQPEITANGPAESSQNTNLWALPKYPQPAGLTPVQSVSWGLLQTLGKALAQTWQNDSKVLVETAFIPLADLSQSTLPGEDFEQQALLFLLGHMLAAGDADESLARICFPLFCGAISQPYRSQLTICALFSVAQCGKIAAQREQRWAFEQAVSILTAAFQSATRLHSPESESACSIITQALNTLVELPGATPMPFRQEVELKLLSLFCDTALNARSDGQLRCLGTLLVPLAKTWGEGNTSSRRSLMSTYSMDFEARKNLRMDTQLVKLYRILWVYIAVHGFANPQANSKTKSNSPRWPVEWRDAAISLAQGPTPLLVAGGEMDVFQVEAELGERVQRLSKVVSPFKVASRLLDGIKSGQVVAPGLVASATHPARNAHLISTLALNLLRVSIVPHSAPPLECPLAPLFATQQVASSKDWESNWLGAITERCFNVYLVNLKPSPSIQGWSGEVISKRLILLAGTLLHTLGDSSHNPDARDLANKLLEKLLSAFPSLTWDGLLLRQFLGALDDPSDSDYPLVSDPRILGHLRKMVTRGMAVAPNSTEALLCEYLRAEPNKSNTQSLKEAQALLTQNYDRSQSQGARIQGPASGVAAWRKKDKYTGVFFGKTIVSSLQERGRLDNLMTDALTELRRALSESSSLLLEKAELITTGLLIENPAQRQAREALRLIASTPGQHLRPAVVRNAVLAWHWIVAAAPDLKIPLLAEIMDSLSVTFHRKKGLFNIARDEPHTEPNFDVGEGLEDDTLEESTSGVDGLIAHHVWLDFLHEIWQVSCGSASPDSIQIAALYNQMLKQSLAEPSTLTQHPAAAGVTFKLLSLGVEFVAYSSALIVGTAEIADILNRIINAALHWFDVTPAYYGDWTAAEKWVEYVAVQTFAQDLDALLRSSNSQLASNSEQGSAKEKLALLKMLLQDEAERLKVWANPLVHANKRGSKLKAALWKNYALAAWEHSPSLAINLVARFPHAEELRRVTGSLVVQHASEPFMQKSPQAAELLAMSSSDPAVLANLKSWAPGELLRSLYLMSSPCGQNPVVRQYALRSLHTCDPDQVAFFLPQLVQLLRSDENGLTEKFLLESAERTIVFAHHLVCTLRSEGTPPEEAFNPEVKRSGWAAPEDTGLWEIADRVEKKVWAVLDADKLAYLKAEIDLFDEVTNVSGKLYPVPKDERKGAAVKFVSEISVPRGDLYLPTNPASKVVSIIPASATPMQSAAKTPILVAFKVLDEKEVEPERVQACIFKVGDDCRQDVLALQVISLLKNAFQKSGLDLYVAPYGVLPTTYERGIIEVVPNSESRSALGETSDGGLLDIWQRKFGAQGSPNFQKAARNFIKSEAGYAIACYLLQAKDRHNGNILVDNLGHLVHIDFGFILEISPGGNLGFESAAFKLSHEMTQILDPSGNRNSPQFRTFQDLCVRGYLAARTVAEGIIATVQLMSESGLPCYGRGQPIANLRKRFHLEMSEQQAAAFMLQTINDAYDKWTTGFYDYVQYLQNSIPK